MQPQSLRELAKQRQPRIRRQQLFRRFDQYFPIQT
jgi:hypothetical protein